MFCDRCGTRNRDGATYCKACGDSLDPAESTIELSKPRGTEERLRSALAGSYDVLRLLGRGGMGEVYLAKELALDRLVALKVLVAGEDEMVRERFLREARLAARLHHPNIISIHSVGEVEGIYYFTMDYVRGKTLAQSVKEKGRLAEAESRELFKTLVKASGHAHREGVIHRDLKPDNIMLESTRQLIVLDFGLAKSQALPGISQSGLVVGTPRYMAPEQIEGKRADAGSDIYALGLIAYFLRTGNDLVTSSTLSGIVAEHLSDAPRKRAAADTRLGLAASLICSMIARDPADRPRSAEEVLAALHSTKGDPTDVHPARRSVEAPKTGSPRRPDQGASRRRLESLLDKVSKYKQEG